MLDESYSSRLRSRRLSGLKTLSNDRFIAKVNPSELGPGYSQYPGKENVDPRRAMLLRQCLLGDDQCIVKIQPHAAQKADNILRYCSPKPPSTGKKKPREAAAPSAISPLSMSLRSRKRRRDNNSPSFSLSSSSFHNSIGSPNSWGQHESRLLPPCSAPPTPLASPQRSDASVSLLNMNDSMADESMIELNHHASSGDSVSLGVQTRSRTPRTPEQSRSRRTSTQSARAPIGERKLRHMR